MQLTRPNVFEKPGRWFKLAMHVHTTNSDGLRSPEWVLDFYKRAGFDAICFGDHSRVTTPEHPDGGILVIPGCELGTSEPGPGSSTCLPHVMCVGVDDVPAIAADDDQRPTFQQLHAAAVAGSAFCFAAHPHWSSIPAEVLAGVKGLTAIEVYNRVCDVHHGLGHAEYVWDMLLNRGCKIDAVAVDDEHWRSDFAEDTHDRGHVMVKAAELSTPAVLAALLAGDYYSSTGPRFESVRFDAAEITVATSAVRQIAFRTRGPRGGRFAVPFGETLAQATATIGTDWPYVRIEITDDQGRKAWTNPFYSVNSEATTA